MIVILDLSEIEPAESLRPRQLEWGRLRTKFSVIKEMCSDKGFNVNMLGLDSVSCWGLTRMDVYYAVEMDIQSPCIETAGISCNGVGGLRSTALHCRIDAFRKEVYVIDR